MVPHETVAGIGERVMPKASASGASVGIPKKRTRDEVVAEVKSKTPRKQAESERKKVREDALGVERE